MGLLRFVGILNAAVWCGSAIFLVVGLPAVFSPQLKHLLTDAGVGYAAETLVHRYFVLQYWCAGIGLAVLAAENLYSGRRVSRTMLALLLALLAIALAGGMGAQPRMARLHQAHYFGKTPAERMAAGREFAVWHAVAESVNLLVIGGLVFYLWEVSSPALPLRTGYFPKIRS